MSSLKIVLPSEVDAVNPIAGDLFLTPAKKLRLTQTLTEEVAQQLYIRFKIFQGEWFLDATLGVPWRQAILGLKVPQGIVAQILKRVIVTCPGVASLRTFNLVPGANRQWALDFSCLLTDGSILKSTDYGPFIIGAGA